MDKRQLRETPTEPLHATHANLGIEPLPDIDFNIRAGNTLVGYATLDAVQRSFDSKFDFDRYDIVNEADWWTITLWTPLCVDVTGLWRWCK